MKTVFGGMLDLFVRSSLLTGIGPGGVLLRIHKEVDISEKWED